jgi:hypothetical protein
LRAHKTSDPFAHHGMVVDGENPNGQTGAHDTSPSTCGVLEANSRDNRDRRDVA